MSEKAKKVSIIIPMYNVAPHAKKCVESVLHQTYKELEIIIINDGSTDNTMSVVAPFRDLDERLKIISWPNHGVSAARNLGIEIATGEFIFFLDGDDWIADNCIERLICEQERENSDIVVGNYHRFRTSSSCFLIHVPEENYYTKTYTPAEWFAEYEDSSEYVLFVVPWGKLYRKKLFSNVRFPVGVKMEDAYTTYLTYLLADIIAFVNEPIYVYRINESGAMGSSSEIEKNPIKCLEEEGMLLSMLGMDMKVVMKKYHERILILKEQLMQSGDNGNNYHKVMSYLEILDKYGYRPD